MAQDDQSPKENWGQSVWLPRCLDVFHQFHPTLTVHKTPEDMDPQTLHLVIHSLKYITNPPFTHSHLYPPRSLPIPRACHDMSDKSLQHKNAEKHQSYFAQATHRQWPQFHLFYCFITSRKETLSILPPQKCS